MRRRLLQVTHLAMKMPSCLQQAAHLVVKTQPCHSGYRTHMALHTPPRLQRVSHLAVQTTPRLQGAPHLAVQTPPRLQRAPHLVAVKTPPCKQLALHLDLQAAPPLQRVSWAYPAPPDPARPPAHLVPPTFSCTISPLLAAAAAKPPQCPPAMSAAGAGAEARSSGSLAGAHTEHRASRGVQARTSLPRCVPPASASRGYRPPAEPGLSSGTTRLHGGRHSRREDGSPRGTKRRSADYGVGGA